MRTARLAATLAIFLVAASSASSAAASSLGSYKTRLVAVGDIACPPGGAVTATTCQQAATYSLAARLKPDHVLVLGDNQYNSGTLADYQASYALTWGKLKSKTFPVPGNHEYYTAGATGYYDYFGSAAGSRTQGWHSSTYGGWRVLGLNSNCSYVGGCQTGSAQEKWLRSNLYNNRSKKCTLALWHHPRFSSGEHGDNPEMADLWETLQDYDAEFVLAGHDHAYERFLPMNSDGTGGGSDTMPSWVVGGGGKSLYPIAHSRPNSAGYSLSFGVLKLDLYSKGYKWRYYPASGGSTDNGTGYCR
jgi:3',5'-cyclic AMP phosphodiesterase CpdA